MNIVLEFANRNRRAYNIFLNIFPLFLLYILCFYNLVEKV